jgi:hypothetical protein
VLDSENDRVQVFEAGTGRWLAAWGTTGQGAGQFRLGDNTGAGGLAIGRGATAWCCARPTRRATARRPAG